MDGPSYLLKLDQARRHLEAITRDVARWLNEDFHLRTIEDGDQGTVSIHWPKVVQAPAVWGLMLGDFAHNANSALDALVYAAILHNDQKPGRNSGYPVHESEARWLSEVQERLPERGPHCLTGVSDPVFEAIKATQPYRERKPKSRDKHPLRELRWLANTDKHRTIHAVEHRVADAEPVLSLSPPGHHQIVGVKVLKRGGPVEPDAEAVRFRIRQTSPMPPGSKLQLDANVAVLPVFGQPHDRRRVRMQRIERMLIAAAVAIDFVEAAAGIKPNFALKWIEMTGEDFRRRNPEVVGIAWPGDEP